MIVRSEEMRIKMFYFSLTIAAIQTDSTNQLFAEAVGTVNAERQSIHIQNNLNATACYFA